MHELRLGGLPDRHALTSARNAGSQERSRSWLLRVVHSLAAAALGVALASSVAAHEDGEMGISVSPDRLPPGSPLPVVGQDFAAGEVLEIVLTGPGVQQTPASVTTDADGHFTVVLQVPPAAQPGTWTVDALSRSGIIQRAVFTVDPAAAAPAMTMSPASVARPPDATGPEPAPAPALIGLAAGALLATVVLVGVRFRQRAGSRPVRGSGRTA